MATPGMDPRQWTSYGTVDADEIEFDPSLGPLIPVTLQPSQVQILCRTMSSVAGNGEGEYVPFVAGDEVLVAIPGGAERSGACVILGKLNNERLPFPSDSVAGQDPTTNTFAFRRVRTPMVEEYEGPYIVRQATSGALLSIDTAGAVTIRDGTKAALQMGPDAFSYMSGDATAMLQLDLSGGRFTLQIGDALLTMSKGGASPEVNALAVPGILSVSASANPAAEHVLTTEALVNFLNNLFIQIGVAIPGPITGAALAAAAIPILSATIAGAAVSPQLPPLAAALFAAFSAVLQKPPGVPGQGQLTPGLGCPGFLSG